MQALDSADRRKTIAVIVFTVVLDTMGFGVIYPIMPDLLEVMGIASIADAALWGGILSAAYALMQFLCAPIMGNLSDAYGRRPILLTAMILMAIDYVALGLATALWMLVVGRMIGGVMGGTISTALACLADISPPEERAKNFGLIGAAFGIGFILGPAMGGIVGEFDARAPFFLSAGLAALNFGCVWFLVPETVTAETRRPFRWSALNPFSTLWRAFSMEGLSVPLTCFFVIAMANAVYPAIWSFWAKESFGWSAGTIGGSLATYGIGAALVQGVLIRSAFITRLGVAHVVLWSLVIGVIAFILFGLASAGWVVFAIIPLAALSDLYNPTLNGFMSNQVPDNEQGALQGVQASIHAITAVLGPMLMAGIFKVTGDAEGAVYFPGAAFWVAAALLAMTIVPLWRATRRAPS